MARELAAVDNLTETEAIKLIEQNLLKGPRRAGKGEAEAEAELDAAEEETDTEEAAA